MTEIPVTMCVLTYGNYFPLAKRCIGSIIEYCPRNTYRLVVGANAVSNETLLYLEDLLIKGLIDELIVSRENLNKSPMMKKMFSAINTPLIWWFDDDSYITEPDAFSTWINAATTDDENIVAWGHQYYFGHEDDFSYGTDVRGFVRNASWYKKLEPPSWEPGGKGLHQAEGRPSGDGRWFFLTGGCWLAKTSLIRLLNWPDDKLIKRNDDVFFCEAIRQQGLSFRDLGSPGVAINTEPRRGNGEDKKTMEIQIGGNGPDPDLGGWFFPEEKAAYQKMAAGIRNGNLVELGVWKGLSLSSILEICRNNNNQVYAIDPWKPISDDNDYQESLTTDIYEVFRNNLRLLGFENNVQVIRKSSVEAAEHFKNESLDLVFIDADHSYESVCADIETWWKKIRTGGILCGHDFTFKEGVCRAVNFYFYGQFELAGGSIWKVIKTDFPLRATKTRKRKTGNGSLFIPTFRDSDLLEENFAGRPELTSSIQVTVVDDNFEDTEISRTRQLCSDNNWNYLHSGRSKHGNWEDHYQEGSAFNFFIWKYFTELGKHFDYVIKADTDAYIIDPGFYLEMEDLLSNARAAAGTIEYRSVNDVGSFWELEGSKQYNHKPEALVPHLQGGIYGIGKKALTEIKAMGFLNGIHRGFSEDGYKSYLCLLKEIPLIPVHTTGSWYHPYRPDLQSISNLKAIHPLTKSEWEKFRQPEDQRFQVWDSKPLVSG